MKKDPGTRLFTTFGDVRQLLEETRRFRLSEATSNPKAGSEPSSVLRLKRCLGMDCKPARLGYGLELDQEVMDVLFVPHPSGGFELAFDDDRLPPFPDSHLGALARLVEPHGGLVRVYAMDDVEQPSTPGVRWVSLRDELRPLVQEPLLALARRCWEGWTSEHEQRFVEGRAKLPTGRSLPVAEALAQSFSANRFVLMLGDFGTGKSTHLAHRAAVMARAHLEAPERFPAPVLLRLGGMKPDLAAIFEKYVEDLSFEAFRLAVDLGMAIPLLDGLDELELPPQAIDSTLTALIGSFSPSHARALLTSRKTLFSSTERMQEILREVDSLTMVELQDMDRAQVIEFVGKRARSAEEAAGVLENIQRVQDLKNLSQRPVLLNLIVESRDRLSSQGMTAARLYAVTVEDWLDSAPAPEDSAVRVQRLALVRSLARLLFATRADSATYEELLALAGQVLGDTFVPVAPAMLRLHGAVFLTPDEKTGRLRFAHRSFLEYFLALDVSERLDAGREEALELPRLTPEIVSFLAGMPGWEQRQEVLRRVLSQPYRRRGSENALLALYLSARASVGEEGEALGRALRQALPEKAQLAGASLASIELPWVSLPGADLSGAELTLTRFDRADFRGARFDRARASHTLFDGALLDGASFREADLFSASLVDASLADVTWEGSVREGLIDLHAEPPPPPSPTRDSRQAPRPVLRSWMKGVFTVIWSPDGRRLASVSYDGAVRLWDARAGTLLHSFPKDSEQLLAPAFSPDGTLLATARSDGRISLWDARSGTFLRSFEHGGNSGLTLVFSPDGAILASATNDGGSCLWDVHSGKRLHGLATGRQGLFCAGFSPDGGTFTFASETGTLQKWDVRSGELRDSLESGQDGGVRMTFSRQGDVLAFASSSSAISLWDARSDTPLLTARSHRYRGPSMSLSSDGGLLAFATAAGKVRIWDVLSKRLLHTLQAHPIGDIAVELSQEGETLASASESGMLRLWNVRSGACLHSLVGHSNRIHTLSFSPGGDLLTSVSDDHTLHVWDVRSGSLLHRLRDCVEALRPVAFSPDGGLLASTTREGTAHIWDTRSGARLHSLEPRGELLAVALAPEGVVLASAAHDGPVHVWEAPSGRCLASLADVVAPNRSVAFSPDGRLLASASENARVRLWEARSGTPHHALQAPSPQLGAMSFSRDGGRLATSSEKGALCLWDVHSGQLLHSFERHLTTVKALAFSPDGGTLASASMEGRLCCWDLRTGTLRHTEILSLASWTPGEPVNIFLSLAFSPDGEVLTAVRHTGDTRSWDTRSYTPLPSKQGRAQSHALLAPDGRTLACASWEGMVRLRAMRGGRGGLLLSVVEDTWVAFLEETPFFIGGGDLSRILHFTSGDRTMSAQLWAPLFQRPELVRAALAGQSPDLTALGLNTSAACEAALLAERTRRGLVRRRSVMP